MAFVRTGIAFTLAFVVAAACSGSTRPKTAIVPRFDQQAITGGFTGALVGTVVDSAAGLPIEHAQLLLRSAITAQPSYAFTDSHGGFVLGRVAPGNYSVLVRALGYAFRTDSVSISSSRVDTLSTRLRRVSTCQGIDCQ